MELEIIIDSDEGTRRIERFFANGPLSIGRHSQCSLCLESDLVSRQHVVLEAFASVLRVEDVSTNGTMAGKTLLRRNMIDVPYDTPIVVGNFTLYVHPATIVAHAPVAPAQRQHPSAAPGLPRVIVGDGPAYDTPSRTRHNAPANGSQTPTGRPTRTTAVPQPMRLPEPREETGTLDAYLGVADPSFSPSVSVATASETLNEARADIGLRREIHRQLLENLDLAKMDPSKFDDPSLRPKVLAALRRILKNLGNRISTHTDQDKLVGELADEALGLGPLERFLADPTITEIMVVDPDTIYIEKEGKLTRADARFTDDERVRAVIERIVTPLGRRIDESSPLVDARLRDGSRVNAVIRPIALKGSCITIRKFSRTPLTLKRLMDFGALTEAMGRFLTRSVIAKKNIVISGGTGSGKTTLLNVLSAAIPPDERIITIEDAAELQLKQPHVVSMETRPANMEGKGAYTIRDLVRNALRMRPDRIVVGECRGGEALDMLQAMNTGHDGSLTTTHANSPEEALSRLETLVLMAEVDLPSRAIREQIAGSINLIVQQSRFSDGTRKITEITEVAGIDDDGTVKLVPIYKFVRSGTGPGGRVLGEYRATGYLPSFLDQFIVLGLVHRGEPYL